MQAQAIRSTRLIGVRPTLDLRVDHPDHNYYAEGIVVSNSHSCAYGYLTAVCTWLKASHPQAFYLAMLKLAKEEPNSTEYMNTIIGEMGRVGVKLLPPDITRSEMDFSIEGDGIRFGLASIKGISEMTFGKLGALRGKTFASKWDLFDAAKGAAIQINMVVGLIYSGTLSWPNTARTKLALEAQTYNLLSDTQKVKVKGYAQACGVDDMIEILKGLTDAKTEKGAPLLPAKQLDRIRRDYTPFWGQYVANSRNESLTALICERHYLGYSYSARLRDLYISRIADLITLDEVKRRGAAFAKLPPPAEGEPRVKQDPVKVVAFIEDMKTGVSKANGTPYYRGSVTDETGSYMVMVYGEENVEACSSFNGRMPDVDDIVLVTGTFSRDGRMIFASSLIVQVNPVMLKRPADASTASA